mgnify:CR=1 FL=1|jgi:hypothetical protein
MSRITVVKPDGLIIVDGEGYNGIDLSFLDANIHAIQWYHTYGEVERKDERGRHLPNEEIDSFTAYETPVMAAWNAKKAETEAATLASLANNEERP